MTRTPIAVFAYNRPEHLRLALSSLARCDRFAECDVHIFCDGPKPHTDPSKVEAARIVAETWASQHNAHVVMRDSNWGLAKSITTGVTTLTDQYDRTIVVEDDHIVSVDFVAYMIEALDRWQNDPTVFQVSGYMFPINNPPSPDAFLLPLTTTWGWATWKRAWSCFDSQATGAATALMDPAWRTRFNLDDSYPYTQMLADRLAGRNQSWGILWWYTVFQRSGLVVYPRRSLVHVGGFDGTGTHCGAQNSGLDQDNTAEFASHRLSDPIQWPLNDGIDAMALNRIKAYLKQDHQSSESIWKRLQRKARIWPKLRRDK